METTFLYSDRVVVSSNNHGFTFNFMKDKTGVEEGSDCPLRICMSPTYAKVFLAVLTNEIGKYESRVGTIPNTDDFVENLKKKETGSMGIGIDS